MTPTDEELVSRIEEHLAHVSSTPPKDKLFKDLARELESGHPRRPNTGKRPATSRHTTPTTHLWRRRVAASLAVVAVAGTGVFAYGAILSTQQVDTFSSINSGLSGGGGVTYAPQTPSASTQQGAVIPGTPYGTGNLSNKSSISNPGTTPTNQQRNVSLGYVIPHGSFQKQFNVLVTIATGMGGYVATSSTQSNGQHQVDRGTIIVDIPQGDLSTYFSDIPTSFTTSYIDFSLKDFSQQQSSSAVQIQQDEALIAVLNEELPVTPPGSQRAALRTQIASLESQIATLKASTATTTATIQMAVLTISLTEQEALPATPPSKFVKALGQGWSNDVAIVSVGVTVILTLIPFALVLGVLWFALRRPMKALMTRIARNRGEVLPPPSNVRH